jgi:26S proteasome regulatory subunit N2
MFLIGMAYFGKAKNKLISKLLHHASADFSDDVRRAAVINLAYLLINSPEQVIHLTLFSLFKN